MKYKPIFYFLLLSCLLQADFSYEVYIESYYPCTGVSACGAYFPSCHFEFGPNIVGTVCFASYYVQSSDPPGVIWGLQGNKVILKSTIDMIHQEGGKVKLCYGGASTQVGQTTNQIWCNTDWQTESVQDEIATNIAAVVEKYGFDGVDFDFEDKPPPGAGAATANVIKLVRQKLNEKNLVNSILTLTVPGQILYGKIGNFDPNNPNTNPYTNPLPSQRIWTKVNPGDSQPLYPEGHAILDNLCNTSTGQIDFSIINHINWMEYCIWVPAGGTVDQQAIADVISYNQGFYKIPFKNMALGMSCGGGPSAASVNYSPDQASNVTAWALQNKLAGVFFWSMNQEVNYNLPNFCNVSIPAGTTEDTIMSTVFKDSYAIIKKIAHPNISTTSPVISGKKILNGISGVTPRFIEAQRAATGYPPGP